MNNFRIIVLFIVSFIHIKNSCMERESFVKRMSYIFTIKPCDSQILDASQKGDLIRIKNALALHANVNIKDKDGLTPLWWATNKCNPAVVNFLLEANADPNNISEDSINLTPLQKAIEQFYQAALKLRVGEMLSNGISYEEQRDNYVKIAISLLKRKAKPDLLIMMAQRNWTPLMVALNQNHTQLALALIEAGADVNFCSLSGSNPLELAFSNDNETIAINLVLGGASIEKRLMAMPLYWVL